MEDPIINSAVSLNSVVGVGEGKECAMDIEEQPGKLISAPNETGIEDRKLIGKDLDELDKDQGDGSGEGLPMDTSGAVGAGAATAATVKTQPQEIRITEDELTTLVMEKFASIFACSGDTDIAKLKDRICEVNQCKDKVSQKLITLQKQVEEVSKAIVENSEHMKNPTEAPPAPLKFCRSVGLQVNCESRAQLSLQGSRKENVHTVPFKRNGVLVGPASVKRNYASKMAETPDGVPSKRPSTSPSAGVRTSSVGLDENVKVERSAGDKSNGSPSGVHVVRPADSTTRSAILQPPQGVGNSGNVVFRSVTPNSRGSAPVPRPGTAIRSSAPRPGTPSRFQMGQPARSRFALPPLPPPSPGGNTLVGQNGRPLPPKPELTLKTQPDGIVLSWVHSVEPNQTEVKNYQIFACQESLQSSRGPAQWKRVGDVKALPLPMACTLSQFTDENRYHFIVRGLDIHNRTGPFCEPVSIVKKRN